MDQVEPLFVCCPKCCKTVVKTLRCDGMEIMCPRCGVKIQVVVAQDARLSVELVEESTPAKNNSVAPRNVELGMNR